MPVSSLSPQLAAFRPLGRKCLVRRLADDEKVGEIFLPANQKKIGLCRGVVEKVGSGVTPDELPEGTTVMYRRELGYHRIELEPGVRHEIVPLSNLLVTVEAP